MNQRLISTNIFHHNLYFSTNKLTTEYNRFKVAAKNFKLIVYKPNRVIG